MSKKRIFIIALAVLTLILSALLFTAAYRADSAKSARAGLENEIKAAAENTEKLKDENDELKKQISDIDAELSTKDTINNYYMEYKKTHDDLTAEVEDLKNQSSELDTKISDKQVELAITGEVKEVKKGQSYILQKGETYSCPEAVPEGRYTATGRGTLTVLNSSDRARVSQNLDVAYGNTYTFNIYKAEKIKVTGDVTLTELK